MAVVAGVLSDGEGRVLLQQRPAGKRHAGLWEFPGGKVEPGESPREALVRELNEELGIAIAAESLVPLAFAEGGSGDGELAIVILLYKVTTFMGTPVAEAGAEISWVAPTAATAVALAPLDVELMQSLRAGDR